ncbi:MAG: M20 family metallopeptidase [Ruminococcaceae bacterium]|nr:M20 family metallopeptidase [Oscillospiraceae bacterium]
MKCEKLFELIDRSEEKYLSILEEVCNIESPTDYKEGVDEVGAYFINIAKAFNWRIEVAEQEISGNVICITMNPDAPNLPISVSGHIDTVHPVGSFGTPAVKRDDKRMYGPGVMDCKGGVVAAVMAMDALEKCGFKDRPVHLLIQTDEENGSASSKKETIKYICEKAKDSAAFLNLEGHKSGTAVLQRKGIIRYRFNVLGKALHSSRCAEASSAIAEAAHKILELEKMKDPTGLTCNCGLIYGGTAANSVADKCCFYADIRFSTAEELEIAKQKTREVADTTYIKGCSCILEEASYRPAMQRSEKNEALLFRMNEIYKENQMHYLAARSCLSGSDAAYATEYGIPCVDNLGTEGSNIHSTDEYIELKSLTESAKRIASVIYCY